MRFLLLSTLFFSPFAPAQPFDPAREFVATGACPFECCTYREWRTRQSVGLHESKDTDSRLVATLAAGTPVLGLTGDVHLQPVKLQVLQAYRSLQPGDEAWLLDYLGEGWFRLWHEGEFRMADLGMGPADVADPGAWARSAGEYRSTWWVNVRTNSGVEGWAIVEDNFSDMDACG